MVTRLRPGVGEKHPNSGQRRRGNQMLQDVDPVSADQPDVAYLLPVDRGQQLRQAPPIYLHRNHVDVRLVLCHGQRRGAGSATDLEHHRCRAAEPRTGVQRRSVLRDLRAAQFWPESIPGFSLGAGESGTPRPKTGRRQIAMFGRTRIRRLRYWGHGFSNLHVGIHRHRRVGTCPDPGLRVHLSIVAHERPM